MRSDVDRFYAAYVAALLWAGVDENDEPLDRYYGPADLDAAAQSRARRDCELFYRCFHRLFGAACLHGDPVEQAGHDFLLTREGHGCGFWEDDDWAAPVGDILTAAAHLFGGQIVLTAADGRLELSGGRLPTEGDLCQFQPTAISAAARV